MNLDKAHAAFSSALWSPQSWPQALNTVAVACNASVVTIVNTAHRGEMVCSTDARPAIDLYLRGRQVPDSRIGRVKPGIGAGFRSDYDDFRPDEIAHDPYYQEFLAPLGVSWHAAAAVEGFEGERLVISFKRSRRQGMFDRCDLDTLDSMLPHIRSIARNSALLARSRFDGQLAAFSSVNRGAILVNAEARILGLNDRVIFGDGLTDAVARLSAAHVDDRTALARAIGMAASTLCSVPIAPVIVRKPSGERPYVIDIIQTRAGDFTDLVRSHALVVINDLALEFEPRRDVVQRAFGLTPKEADLGHCIGSGKTLREAAASLRISEQHARQRLKVLFDKTQTSRQSDLRALLTRLA